MINVLVLMIQVAIFLGLLALVCVGGLFVLGNLMVGLWQLPYLIELRPKLAGVVGVVCALIAALAVRILVPAADALATVFGVAAIAPWFIQRITAYVAWRTDPAGREAAAEVRNEIAGRLQEAPVRAGRYWPAYVFDAERARRNLAYDPPPI